MDTYMLLLTIFVGIVALSNVVLLFGLAFLALSMKRLVDKSVTPAINEVQTTIQSVNSLVDKLEDRAERIMNVGEDTVRKVSGKVVATTDIVQETITSPLINLSSALTGIAKAVQSLRRETAKT